jgi:hypothetical protein
MRRSGLALLVAVTLVSLATGCSDTKGGTPTTGSAVTTTESTSAKPSSARPREIKLNDKDPCQLLTSAQLAELKYDRAGKPEDAPAYKAKGCAWSVVGHSVRVLPVTSEGIEVWTNGKRTGQAQEVAPVSSFPAITVTLPSDKQRCDLMVDTAEDQYLMVTHMVSSSFEDRVPERCDGARLVAEAIMANLAK